jgi:hypothetical protein
MGGKQTYAHGRSWPKSDRQLSGRRVVFLPFVQNSAEHRLADHCANQADHAERPGK